MVEVSLGSIGSRSMLISFGSKQSFSTARAGDGTTRSLSKVVKLSIAIFVAFIYSKKLIDLALEIFTAVIILSLFFGSHNVV